MPGIAALTLGAAPIAGGALLGIAAGGLKGPDYRSLIKQDLDLLERIPQEQADRRERLQQSINDRIDDMIAASETSRAIREVAFSYRGNWRDSLVFICAVLFTIVWWNVSHDRANWLLMFVVMVLLSIVSAIYAARGALGTMQRLLRRRRRG
ncbi:hypothetical protein A5753_23155 [Mycobacterium sp. 852002-51971_SCH5477799-a]|uniref:hypothetical protein n=1 Tax=Mycobacterium sp. 852002-51971_SCH5477799-a TaxID=1834106 RepID=UPI0008010B55|nr:hypothetical protein [Mycobacterium sp. 852002-51971_SCH5477799-a]OBF68040.1 hypothetical protein A5753_23155 [Mycobacterium sp. 852002-51971_SCH5477799-a]